MSDVMAPEPETPSSLFRRTRVLLALGPLAGTLGALLGAAVIPDALHRIAMLPPENLRGLVSTAYFGGVLLTMIAIVVGMDRGLPLHSLKACATIAALLFFPGLFVGVVIASVGC